MSESVRGAWGAVSCDAGVTVSEAPAGGPDPSPKEDDIVGGTLLMSGATESMAREFLICSAIESNKYA